MILVVGPLLISAGLLRCRQGCKPAIFYSAGWVIFVSSIIIYSLRLAGLVPTNTFTNYAILAASLWEAVLFSFALAYRIKVAENNVAQAKNAFLGMVSHELKTPLQRITSSIDLLLTRHHEEINRQPLLRIQFATEHLSMQVSDLTDFARLESGKLRLRPSDFDPQKMLDDLVGEFAPQAEAKGLEFRSHTEEVEAMVHADAMRIQQILTNLLSNAIKYTNRGYAVAENLRNVPGRNRRTPIVWISATISYDMAPEQRKLFVHCLEKPIRIENLNSMLRHVLLHGSPEQYAIGDSSCTRRRLTRPGTSLLVRVLGNLSSSRLRAVLRLFIRGLPRPR